MTPLSDQEIVAALDAHFRRMALVQHLPMPRWFMS